MQNVCWDISVKWKSAEIKSLLSSHGAWQSFSTNETRTFNPQRPMQKSHQHSVTSWSIKFVTCSSCAEFKQPCVDLSLLQDHLQYDLYLSGFVTTWKLIFPASIGNQLRLQTRRVHSNQVLKRWHPRIFGAFHTGWMLQKSELTAWDATNIWGIRAVVSRISEPSTVSLDIIASHQLLRFLPRITINRKWVLDGLAISLATFWCPSRKLLFNVHTRRPPEMKPKLPCIWIK